MTRKTNKRTYDQIMTGSLLEPRQLEVYHALFHCGPMGKTALNKMCAEMTKSDLTEEWSGHFANMFGNSLLVYIGTQACPQSGLVELIYDVTDEMPHPRRENHGASPAPAQQEISGTEASATTTTPAGPLKDSKPKPKSLKEAVDYIAMAVKLMAADNGEQVPETVQHTLRWMRKPIERKRKRKDNSQGSGNSAEQSA